MLWWASVGAAGSAARVDAIPTAAACPCAKQDAFRWAAAVDPTAGLCINDYDVLAGGSSNRWAGAGVLRISAAEPRVTQQQPHHLR